MHVNNNYEYFGVHRLQFFNWSPIFSLFFFFLAWHSSFGLCHFLFSEKFLNVAPKVANSGWELLNVHMVTWMTWFIEPVFRNATCLKKHVGAQIALFDNFFFLSLSSRFWLTSIFIYLFISLGLRSCWLEHQRLPTVAIATVKVQLQTQQYMSSRDPVGRSVTQVTKSCRAKWVRLMSRPLQRPITKNVGNLSQFLSATL